MQRVFRLASLLLISVALAGCGDSSVAENSQWDCSPAPSCKNYTGKGINKNGGKFDGLFSAKGEPKTGMISDANGEDSSIENGTKLSVWK
jgi:hypothetical protein